ncbi:MAG: hypothetical protein ABSF40_08025, partial [Candidatus Acidiferrales bacterium]
MRQLLSLLVIAGLSSLASVSAKQSAKDSRLKLDLAGTHDAKTVDDVIDRVITREHEEIEVVNSYDPIVETYVQVYSQKRSGARQLSRDYYYLGQAELSDRKQFGYRS